MKKAIAVMAGALFLVAAIGLTISAEKTKEYYVCNCKDDCKCNFVSDKAGKCSCGSPLVAMHLLAIQNGSAKFCSCGKDCNCEISKTDPSKCSCGKAIKTVSLKGKYICACGKDCKCGTISDKPGKCHCGMDLKKVA